MTGTPLVWLVLTVPIGWVAGWWIAERLIARLRRKTDPEPVDAVRDYTAWKAARRRRDEAAWQDEWARLTGTRYTPEADAILASWTHTRPGPNGQTITDHRLGGYVPGPRYTEALRAITRHGMTAAEAAARLRPPYRLP